MVSKLSSERKLLGRLPWGCWCFQSLPSSSWHQVLLCASSSIWTQLSVSSFNFLIIVVFLIGRSWLAALSAVRSVVWAGDLQFLCVGRSFSPLLVYLGPEVGNNKVGNNLVCVDKLIDVTSGVSWVFSALSSNNIVNLIKNGKIFLFFALILNDRFYVFMFEENVHYNELVWKGTHSGSHHWHLCVFWHENGLPNLLIFFHSFKCSEKFEIFDFFELTEHDEWGRRNKRKFFLIKGNCVVGNYMCVVFISSNVFVKKNSDLCETLFFLI